MNEPSETVPFSQLTAGESFRWNHQTFRKASDRVAVLVQLASGNVPAMHKEIAFDVGTVVEKANPTRAQKA